MVLRLENDVFTIFFIFLQNYSRGSAELLRKTLHIIYTQYLLSQTQRFSDITRESTTQCEKLVYTVTDSKGSRLLNVELKSGTPLELKITPLNSDNSHRIIEEAKQHVLIALQISLKTHEIPRFSSLGEKGRNSPRSIH